MIFQNNPQYQQAAQEGIYRIYIPVNVADGYHTSRYVEALNQQIYSDSGATKDVLNGVMDEMILRCNNQQDLTTLRTDIAALANSVKYRLKYPVDQHCAIRTGAILSFMEYEKDGQVFSEDPNKCEHFWIEKKTGIALDYPQLYSFFLTWGRINTPSYSSRSDTLTDLDYFSNRDQMISSLQPLSKTG